MERGCPRLSGQPQQVEKLYNIGWIPTDWFSELLRLIPLSGTQPRSGAVDDCNPNYLAI